MHLHQGIVERFAALIDASERDPGFLTIDPGDVVVTSPLNIN
jgi:hypothetical protein